MSQEEFNKLEYISDQQIIDGALDKIIAKQMEKRQA